MGGHKNRILRVDLTTGTFSEESLSEELVHSYIGGRGFGAKLLYDDLQPSTDPLGEGNELIFVTGPLGGTNAQSFSRSIVTFKSPLTGTYFRSCGGGYLASEMKYSGFDVVVIKGIAVKPTYLWIHDGQYELKDATYLWGLDCDDTHTLIREELGDHNIRLACIGPAGERKVKYAGIFTDRRACGRGGGGAVMGSKNLKAIALRGSEKIELSNPDAFAEAVKQQVMECRNHPVYPVFSVTGPQTPEFTNVLGIFPTRNFQEGVLPNWQWIEGSEYSKLRVRKTRCHSCMVHCGNIIKIGTGKYAGAWSEGPDYETIWAFTGSMGVADIGLTIAADRLCDDLGIDTVSTGNTIGFAYELYEKGIITREDTGGLELVFGNNTPVLQFIRQIAYREGFGDILADGTREAARRIGKGAEQYAMQAKGLELPGYDPRGAKAMGLNYATSNIGANHNIGYPNQETAGIPVPKPVDRFDVADKGEITKWNQDFITFYETAIACAFPATMGMITLPTFGKLLVAAIGIAEFADPAYLWQVGERIYNLERMFNVREGFSSKDDILPRRFTEERMSEGPSSGQVYEAEPLLKDYYHWRGWDAKTGVPTKKKLNELGLSFTIDK